MYVNVIHKILGLVILLYSVALSASAQTTVVSGTITDPGGNPYANGTASAIESVNLGQNPGPTTNTTTSSAGFFTMTLASPGYYTFTICAPPVKLGPTTNPTPTSVCFRNTPPLLISGSTQNVSVILSSYAAIIGPSLPPNTIGNGNTGNLSKYTSNSAIGDSGIAATSVPFLNSSNIWTSNNNFLGNLQVNGIAVPLASIANAWTNTNLFQNSGVFTNTQMNQYIQSLVNSPNTQFEFQTAQGFSNYATEAFTAGMFVPSSSTVYQPNVIGCYLNSQSNTSHGVCGYFSAHASANTASGVWALNTIVTVDPGVTAKITSGEIDMNQNSGTDSSAFNASLIQDGFDIISGGTNKPRVGLSVGAAPGAAPWKASGILSYYDTFGLLIEAGSASSTGIKVYNSNTGTIGLDIVPPDNTIASEITGRNAADSATVWSVTNSGAALFVTTQSQFFTQNTNFATSGILNCSSSDNCLAWRNNANTADIEFSKNTSDQLVWNGNLVSPIVGSLTTGGGTTDTVALTGMTSTGHCSLTATNSSAAANIGTTYISAKTTNQITVTHTATASMTYDVVCTSY
jgi:hypothetical protein